MRSPGLRPATMPRAPRAAPTVVPRSRRRAAPCCSSRTRACIRGPDGGGSRSPRRRSRDRTGAMRPRSRTGRARTRRAWRPARRGARPRARSCAGRGRSRVPSETGASWRLYGRVNDSGAPAPASIRDLGLHARVRELQHGAARLRERGSELWGLLEELVASWPGGAREIALIGSARWGASSAAARATRRSPPTRAWVEAVRRTALGAPHLGAPLDEGVNVPLGLEPDGETRPIAQLWK